MKDLIQSFITEADRARIVESVKKSEKATAGEIVPVIVSSSGDYPVASIIGAMAMSLPLALIGVLFIGPLIGAGARDLWVFLGIETPLYIIGYLIVGSIPWLKRVFIRPADILEQVRASAVSSFYLNGLHRTRDETGILLYVSIFERTVWVLGDRGINQKVGRETWDELVEIITEGIKNKRQAEALCRAIERAGEILGEHFPVRPDDRDELPNIITEK